MTRRQDREVYKFIPFSPYDILVLEGWLEELAGQGLFPVHLGAVYCKFSHTGIPGTRFRLEPFGALEEPTQEQLEMYSQAGWTYAMPAARRSYFLFYTTDPQAPEPYTDWSSRGLSLDRLARQARKQLAYLLLIPLLLLVLYAGVFLFFPTTGFDLQPAGRWVIAPLILLGLFTPLSLLWFLVLLARVLLELQNCRILAKTRQNLTNGLPPPPSPGRNRWVWLDNAATLPILLLACLVTVWTFRARAGWDLEDCTRPYLSLAQLEQVPVAHYEELFGGDGTHSEDRMFRDLSLLAPVYYTVEEYAYEATSQKGNGFSPVRELWSHYAPQMTSVRLWLLIPSMARGAAEAEMNSLRAVNLYYEYEELEVPGLDFAILTRNTGGFSQIAALGRGHWAAVFRYTGAEDLRDHLELLSSMVR